MAAQPGVNGPAPKRKPPLPLAPSWDAPEEPGWDLPEPATAIPEAESRCKICGSDTHSTDEHPG